MRTLLLGLVMLSACSTYQCVCRDGCQGGKAQSVTATGVWDPTKATEACRTMCETAPPPPPPPTPNYGFRNNAVSP